MRWAHKCRTASTSLNCETSGSSPSHPARPIVLAVRLPRHVAAYPQSKTRLTSPKSAEMGGEALVEGSADLIALRPLRAPAVCNKQYVRQKVKNVKAAVRVQPSCACVKESTKKPRTGTKCVGIIFLWRNLVTRVFSAKTAKTGSIPFWMRMAGWKWQCGKF